MGNIFLFFIIFLNLFNAQIENETIRVVYNLDFKPLINQSDTRKITQFNLYIDAEGNSIFIEQKLIKLFRLDNPANEGEFEIIPNSNYFPDFRNLIIKKENSSILHIEEFFNFDIVAKKETAMSPSDWQIKNESEEINGLNTQVATCDFGGRKWTAWFAPEIAIYDGPYKFSGLPGLIVKLESDDGDFIFNLTEISKIQSEEYHLHLPKYRLISSKEFKKIFKNLDENPGEYIRNYGQGKMTFTIVDKGKVLNRQEADESLRKSFINKNNIEPYYE